MLEDIFALFWITKFPEILPTNIKLDSTKSLSSFHDNFNFKARIMKYFMFMEFLA